MDAHLTSPHNSETESRFRETAIGQAHFAGTGPEGTRCVTCLQAAFAGYYAGGGMRKGTLKPIGCRKYLDLMGHMPKFNCQQRSCRFYEPGGEPPKKP